MNMKWGHPIQGERKAGDASNEQETAKKRLSVNVPSGRHRSGSLLFEFFDLNLKSEDYRKIIQKANKDAE